MNFAVFGRCLCVAILVTGAGAPVLGRQADGSAAQARQPHQVRVVGVIRDGANAVVLPGVPVEIVGTGQVTHTDVDGRFVVQVPPGTHQMKVAIDGYEPKTISVRTDDRRELTVDVTLSMSRFSEVVTVQGEVVDMAASSAEAQLVERKNAQVITDNVGAQEMKSNGDSDAASALQRVTGLSVVDNQFVFVRGLGERYSNTTLAGAVIPTTEPDKKVVPLDLFPTALIDSVQITKSYTPDRSADFAGGLVEIMPQNFVRRQVLDVSIGANWYETASGKQIPFSPLDGKDHWGFDDGARALPAGLPANKIVRRGIFTPDVGFSPAEIASFGRLLDNTWTPVREKGSVVPGFNVSYGNSFGRLGVLASVNQSYKEQRVEEVRRFFSGLGEGGALEPLSDYTFDTATQKAQLGVIGNLSYQFTPAHRIAFENFYTHTGRDEGRVFEGPNYDANFYYRNFRLQFIEEGLFTNKVSGEHFLQGWGNSRIDWRASLGRANRDEPDLRETLYQAPMSASSQPTGNFVLADESQSGFRMFNALNDDTTDVALNWSFLQTIGGRPAVYKIGPSFVRRTRDFASRRFRFIPANLSGVNLTQTPEQLFTSDRIGTAFRFNEETRPVDAYDAEQTTVGGYAMADLVLSTRSRLVAGVRVERFDQEVITHDPFGLFEERIAANLKNTDVFPGVNFVYSLRPNTNLRFGYSQTVNRPEFRELAAFEFTDVVGNRAIQGNPELKRSLIQNFDVRLEAFTGGRGVLAGSVFFKRFADPIERVISSGAQPLQTFENAERARNLGVELEAGRQFSRNVYASLNYTFVDSTITLTDEAINVQTSRVRPLAGQSKNLFNAIGEVSLGGFQGRVLYNFFGDRITDVGAFGAPDIVEQGRGSVDVVLQQRLRGVALRLALENLTDERFLFTQGVDALQEEQRRFKLGRVITFSLGYSFF